MYDKLDNGGPIYFLRHGQTDWNLHQLLQGRNDTSLNQTGVQQAILLSKTLSKLSIVGAICSPLLRARQTFELLKLNVPVNFDPHWQELSLKNQDEKHHPIYSGLLERIPPKTLVVSHGSVFESLCHNFGISPIRLNNCELVSISSSTNLK